jgi:hypothetical protein
MGDVSNQTERSADVACRVKAREHQSRSGQFRRADQSSPRCARNPPQLANNFVMLISINAGLGYSEHTCPTMPQTCSGDGRGFGSSLRLGCDASPTPDMRKERHRWSSSARTTEGNAAVGQGSLEAALRGKARTAGIGRKPNQGAYAGWSSPPAGNRRRRTSGGNG